MNLRHRNQALRIGPRGGMGALLISALLSVVISSAVLADAAKPILSYQYEWGEPGTGTGRFRAVRGIVAHDRKGSDRTIIVVADGGRDLVRAYTWDLMFIDKWGSAGEQPGEFREPRGVAVDKSGHLVVVDSRNHRIQKTAIGTTNFLERPGKPMLTFGSRGTANGQFNMPTGVAIDSGGNILVVDTENHRVQKFDGNGKFLATWGAQGTREGQFYLPSYIAIDIRGHIYVSDTGNNRVQVFDPQAKFVRSVGAVGTGAGHFAEPKGIALDTQDNLWVVDRRNHRLQKFSRDGKPLGTFGGQGPGKGEFSFPEDLTFDSAGRVYVTDGMNGRIQVFKAT